MTKEDFNSLPLAELKAMAKNRGMKGTSGLRKEALAAAILEWDAAKTDAQTEVQEPIPAAAAQPPRQTPPKSAVRPPRRNSQPSDAQPARRNFQSGDAQPPRRNAQADDAQPVNRNSQLSDAQSEKQILTPDVSMSGNEPVQNFVERSVDDERMNRQRQTYRRRTPQPAEEEEKENNEIRPDILALDKGRDVKGILEIPENMEYGFLRTENYLKGDNDVYVSPSQIRRFRLETGDQVVGSIRERTSADKYHALLYVKSVNGRKPDEAYHRKKFDNLIPIFPDEKLVMEYKGCSQAMRLLDIFCPIGKGQRGMIVSPPKAGKTTLLKDIASSILHHHPEMHLIVVLIDERPEEVTDFREAIHGENVEVAYSTFDNEPEKHRQVAEMAITHAKRLVELDEDVVILIDSITRLTRAYNLTCQGSGRTLSGGLDPVSLTAPKRFFGAARNIRDGGSLTILATALVETGSKMDDVVYEEFKGTGNMELVLDRRLQERRIFPAIDITRSGTRRDDLLLTPEEMEAGYVMRRTLDTKNQEESYTNLLRTVEMSQENSRLVQMALAQKNNEKK